MRVYECRITLNGILECKWNFKENNIAYIVSLFQILTRSTDVVLAKNLRTYAQSILDRDQFSNRLISVDNEMVFLKKLSCN